MLGEFKAFIARGNVLDLAVAVIIGAAFAAIVGSLTDDLIMPLISAIFGNMDFSNHYVLLGPLPDGYSGPMTYAALKAAGVPVLGYGQFLTALINFLILAFVIFLLVRAAARATARREAEDKLAQSDVPDNMLSVLAAVKEQTSVLTAIREELGRRG